MTPPSPVNHTGTDGTMPESQATLTGMRFQSSSYPYSSHSSYSCTVESAEAQPVSTASAAGSTRSGRKMRQPDLTDTAPAEPTVDNGVAPMESL